jgi:pyruvate/2-oxoglutarate dehydrogenase complex dihydrolipoamide acyltransferase (E2) component
MVPVGEVLADIHSGHEGEGTETSDAAASAAGNRSGAGAGEGSSGVIGAVTQPAGPSAAHDSRGRRGSLPPINGMARMPAAPAAPSAANSAAALALTSPAVRRLARELHVDLMHVPPSGPGGRITRSDVEAFAAALPTTTPIPATPAVSPHASSPSSIIRASSHSLPTQPAPHSQHSTGSRNAGNDELDTVAVPVRGYRRAMVRSMTAAAAIPHFHYCEEVRMEALGALRMRLKVCCSWERLGGCFTGTCIQAGTGGVGIHEYMDSRHERRLEGGSFPSSEKKD